MSNDTVVHQCCLLRRKWKTRQVFAVNHQHTVTGTHSYHKCHFLPFARHLLSAYKLFLYRIYLVLLPDTRSILM